MEWLQALINHLGCLTLEARGGSDDHSKTLMQIQSSFHPRCLTCILWSFFGLELKDLASVEDTRVVGVPDDRFSFGLRFLSAHFWRAVRWRLAWQSVDPAVWMNHVSRAFVHGRGVHWLLRVATNPLEIQLLHLLQFKFVCRASCWVSRIVTYLVKRLNVPFGVLEELVNVLSEHLLEVAILHTTFSSASFGCLDHCSTVCLPTVWFSTHSFPTAASSKRFWNLWKSVIWIEAACNAHQSLNLRFRSLFALRRTLFYSDKLIDSWVRIDELLKLCSNLRFISGGNSELLAVSQTFFVVFDSRAS